MVGKHPRDVRWMTFKWAVDATLNRKTSRFHTHTHTILTFFNWNVFCLHFNGANRMRWEQPGQGTSVVFNPKMADVLWKKPRDREQSTQSRGIAISKVKLTRTKTATMPERENGQTEFCWPRVKQNGGKGLRKLRGKGEKSATGSWGRGNKRIF